MLLRGWDVLYTPTLGEGRKIILWTQVSQSFCLVKKGWKPELIFLADSRFGTDISGQSAENPELISFGRP